MSYPQYTQTPSIPDESPGSGQPSAPTGESSMTEQATEVAQQGKQAANDVAQTATEQIGEVKDEAVRQARDLVGEARGQITAQAGQGHQALVSNLRSLSSELGRMTESSQEPGVATELASRAQQHTSSIADWLESKEPAQVLDDVRDFARRRPGAFLLGALAAGVVAGRLARSAVEVHTGDSGNGSSSSGAHPGADAQAAASTPSYSTPAPSSPEYGSAAPATAPIPQTGASYSAPSSGTGQPGPNDGGW